MSNGLVSPSSKWSKVMRDAFQGRQRPVVGTVEVDKLEQAAREKLQDRRDAFYYVFGSAGTCSTNAANRRQFEKWGIIPRMLRDVTDRSIETTIFGVKYASPVLLAPIGVQGIVHGDAELASAAAAAKLGVPFIMSTASTRSIEAVGKASGSGPRWYQLYWPRTPEVTLSILSRAKASGFSTLVITLDTMSLGWRPHDIDTAYLPFFHGVGAQIGFTDPVFMGLHNLAPLAHDDVPEFPYDPEKIDRLITAGDKTAKLRSQLGEQWIGQVTSGTFRTWEDLKFIQDNWDGEIVLKGIQNVQDAELAVDYGINGIVVSNHGGRQVDGAIASLYALEQICKSPKVREAQASGQLTVLFDSGIRTGSDIFKALALGAQAVLYARPYMYGLAVAGQAGVENVVQSLLADFEITLGLSGYRSVSEIQGKGQEVLARME
ncbi:FMN-dependent alpha-hydroxy acid dehydrogenase [Obba rivulosa]|uniref:FMN-dependent alpha-hydroxy acid dehydrogenase n=1 Tax=Obba rivulosa TaxID=1052685 RepID=A0A8E2DHU3_9APHY|nr:FMN-dependent alpha-hydroxy acid dehydrogenase [Obba rivulosa]